MRQSSQELTLHVNEGVNLPGDSIHTNILSVSNQMTHEKSYSEIPPLSTFLKKCSYQDCKNVILVRFIV